MTKKIFSVLVFSMMLTGVFAQRYAIVDVSTVLDKLSEYQKAQSELDKVAADWRQEIAQEYDQIKSLYNKYQAEQVLLSDQARVEKEEEIMNREKQVRDLQKQRFGPDGDLFRRREELVQPIQDKVYGAIQEYAEDRGYDAIFDKSGSAGIIFASDDLDKTDEILRRLNVRK